MSEVSRHERAFLRFEATLHGTSTEDILRQLHDLLQDVQKMGHEEWIAAAQLLRTIASMDKILRENPGFLSIANAVREAMLSRALLVRNSSKGLSKRLLREYADAFGTCRGLFFGQSRRDLRDVIIEL